MLPIRGITDEPATVTVNGQPASTRSDNGFEGKVAVTAGDNTVTVAATDVNGNTATNRYNLTVTGSGSKTLVYDQNGNLTSDGTRTFEWDPLNRLTAVNSSTNRSEFTYNGLSQRVTIVEKDNGSVTSTKQFVWTPGDTQPSEERDGSNAVTKRFDAQGEQVGDTSYYYTRDHLGSIREMTDAGGVIQARYDYDPYGRLTKVQGDLDSDFTYAGYYNHSPSGLYTTLNRLYDPDLGRWISQDPIGETGGLNLYSYVANDPANAVDPLGLESEARFYIYCKCKCDETWRLVRVEVVHSLGGSSVTYGPSVIHTNPNVYASAAYQQVTNPYTPSNPATVSNSLGGSQTLAHECGHTCQAKKLGPFYLPTAGLNSLLEILGGGYGRGLGNLITPTERSASENGMFGGFAPTPNP